MLRPVLEAALVVARLGEQADPRQPAPPPLRRFLTFRRFPPRALDAARRVLDDDEGFRARVRAAVDDAAVGEAGLVFLDRPAGWEERLATLGGGEEPDDPASAVPRLRRELDRTRQALVRAEAAGAEARREAEAARRALDAERAARRAAEAGVVTAAERADALDEARRTALGNLRATEARHAERTAAWRAARARVDELELELDAERAKGGEAGAIAAEPDGPVADRPVPEAGRGAVEVVERGADDAALAAAVGAAASAAAALSAALADAAALVGSSASRTDPTPRTVPSDPPPRADRRLTPLPSGMRDDGPEAAAHLLRVPGMVVLVDGYNVSIGRWSDLRLDQQRSRLVDLLVALHARTGADVVVVFDGADVGRSGLGGRGAGVQVRFTAADVEADDVLLDTVGAYPVDRPVTVVSDDRRVRDGARRRGANVLSVEQLLTEAGA